MKIISSILFLGFGLAGCYDEAAPEDQPKNEDQALVERGKPGGGEDPQPTGPWTLIFEEEFDTDLSAWNIWEGGAYNEEIQLYRPEQVSLSDGKLLIQAQREAVTGPTTNVEATTKDFEYVSGRIESKDLYGPSATEGEQQYRFVARIRLPAGHGLWPAFWTYGDPWPTQGEIDILEARGGEPTKFQSNIFYGRQAGRNINRHAEAYFDTGVDLTADFHEYEMIWTSNSIEIWFDGERLHTYTASRTNNIENLFGKKEKVTLNTAVGGLFFTDRNSANYADAGLMEVDWVRVYRR